MMNDEPNNTGAGLNAEDLCVAAMLRACADGELCSEQCDRLRRYLRENPEAECQVAFEKALKECCDRVMTAECVCPDSLRSKIEAMACECMNASGIEVPNQRTRRAGFWKLSPMTSGMSAMAAVLVLAGGVLIYQSASIITRGGGLGSVEGAPVAYAERVGNFVAREHMRCCEEEAAAKKLTHTEISASIAYFSGRFEQPVTSPVTINGQEEVRYYGGGDCNLPATERSGHLRFDVVGPEDEIVSLSLFIAPDPGLLELEEGITYLLNSTLCSEQGAKLFAWVSDGVMYLLVSEADESMCAAVRSMMKAPDEIRRL